MDTSAKTTIIILAALSLLVFCGRASTAELHVPGTYGTIQDAIDASVNGDVVIVADGTYVGAKNKNLDFAGRAITVMSENGPDNCIIDCEGSGRGFIFQSGENANSVVDGFTITNGRDSVGGGGIRIIESDPSIFNCILRDNSVTGHGGGIRAHQSQAQIANCKFINNSATGSSSDGGAIILYFSDVSIKNCLFIGNRCPNAGGGAAMRNWESNPTLINCTFSANSSSYAPIDNSPSSHPVFTNCIFWGNGTGYTIQSSSGSCTTLIHCDVEGGWNGPKVGGCVINGGGNINTDPNFVDPTNADMYARDYHLNEGSPCIDAGAEVDLDFDLDGNQRPFDYPGVDNNGELPDFDIGAYELVLPTPYELAISNILNALEAKLALLNTIESALADEQAAYDYLQEMLDSGEYDGLTKGDIIKAMQKVHSATQHQDQAIHQVDKSIEKLDDALDSLDYESSE
jgi:hypothetical protein